jgi:hypothetical protein
MEEAREDQKLTIGRESGEDAGAGAAMLLRLAKSPDGLTAIMGDAIDFTLTPMFISYFGKDARALQEIVENASAGGEVKACALTALAYAAASGMTDRATLEHWLIGLPVLWEKAEDVFATGAGLIPDATRKAIYADTLSRMESKAEEKAQREADKRAKAIAKSAKANSNTSPKVNGALVG